MHFSRAVRFSVFAVLVAGLAILATPAASQAQVAVGISVHIGPPAIPVYAQPVIPAPGYIWTPGYWAYGPGGYYWVPGTWVQPPVFGVLWTPGYWGWGGGAYIWHGGYWGPHVGFYGGINYGYGYGGVGFAGGYWRGNAFYYNRAVANVNTAVIHNTYHTTVVENVNRVSYNGGQGGIAARPTTAELQAEHERHVEATHEQLQHEHAASTNRAMFASANHGQPSIAATSRPGQFHGEGVVAARPASMEANRAAENRSFNNANPNQPHVNQPNAAPNGAHPPVQNAEVHPNNGQPGQHQAEQHEGQQHQEHQAQHQEHQEHQKSESHEKEKPSKP
jgi:WXXGXW repeat (2 copies)